MPLDAPRVVTMALYRSAHSPRTIASGAATPLLLLTPLVTRARQSESELTLTLTWHDELVGEHMPEPGQWVAARLNDTLLCIMLIETVTDYQLRSGTRSMTITARSRDATSAWRDDPIATERYPQGTLLTDIITDVATELGLDASEVQLPADAYGTPQAGFQASNLAAWELISQCLLVLGRSPFVDGLGRLRAYSRDLLARAADVTLAEEQVIGFVGAKALSPIDKLTVKWRAPVPEKVSQEETVLGSTTVSGGYWARSCAREIYWSEDRTQQADLDPQLLVEDYTTTLNSGLFVKQDINRGLIDVGNQFFIPIYAEAPDGTRGGCIGCTILVNMTHHRDDIITTLIGGQVLLAATPDGVNVIGGHTISIGRIAQATVGASILTLMCSIGTGVYEVRGRPYDLVNPVNETVAYDPNGSPGGRFDTVETDLCDSEERAQAIATREFIYRARAASSLSLTIVDDPRIEVGDIVAMPDGTRIAVTGVQRDLSPGSSNVAELSGFPA